MTLDEDCTISARGLSKSYPIGDRSRSKERFLAVNDVSFDIRKGEVVAIVGRNGSGKTTLLKLLCQVVAPNAGEARIRGRISALLGVGTGMHPAFSGRENIHFSGTVLGLDPDVIRARINDIVEFAGIGDFIDRPVKTYSSGMRARLGFAIAAQLNPQILFLDEVLAVGDAGFQDKCLGRIREMRATGCTILLVTHSMNTVKSFCDRAILLDKGRLIMDGVPEQVVDHYLTNIIGQSDKDAGAGLGTREGNGAVQIDDHWLEDAIGQRIDRVTTGQDVVLCLAYSTREDLVARNISIGVAFADAQGRWVFRAGSDVSGHDFTTCPPNGVFRCQIKALPLTPGRWKFGYRVVAEKDVADYVVNYGEFDVEFGDYFGVGYLDTGFPAVLRQEWSLQRDALAD